MPSLSYPLTYQLSGPLDYLSGDIVDWSTWRGNADGSPYFYEDNGYAGPVDFVWLSNNTQFIQTNRTRAEGSQTEKRKVELFNYNRSTGEPTLVDSLELSVADAATTQSSIIDMGNNRFLVGFFGTGAYDLFLVGLSGSTLSELDHDDFTTGITTGDLKPRAGFVGKFSDVLAVLSVAYTGQRHYLTEIDITGDTISYTTPFNTGMAAFTNYWGAGCKYSDDHFVISTDELIRIYENEGGGTFTAKSTSDIVAAGTKFKNHNVKPWGSDKIVIAHCTASDLFFTVFSVSGDTLSRLSTADIGGGEFDGGVWNRQLDQVGENQFMFVGTFVNLESQTPKGILITLDPDTNAITSTPRITVMTGGDHVAVRAVPNMDYAKVLCMAQDGNTTPADKINYTTLNGYKTPNESANAALIPVIALSATSIAEDALVGDLVATMSVTDGYADYTFSITADPDSKFVIDGTDNTRLELENTIDYETKTSHSVTIEADNGVDDVLELVQTITVTDVVEPTADGLAQFSDYVIAEWLVSREDSLDSTAKKVLNFQTPSNGDTQSDYDLTYETDFVVQGTEGVAGTYLKVAGSPDKLYLTGGNTTFIDEMHEITNDFTACGVVNVTDTGFITLFSTCSSTAANGIEVLLKTNQMRVNVDRSGVRSTTNYTVSFSSGDEVFWAAKYVASTDTMYFALGSDTFTSLGDISSDSAPSTAGTTFSIMSRNDGNVEANNDSGFYGGGLLEEAITDSQLADIRDYYETATSLTL